MRRIVYHGQVINSGKCTCGQCKQIRGRRCLHFDIELQYVDYGGRTTFARTQACKETEIEARNRNTRR